jgi:bacterioferritin-associated ferredoxin
VYICLCNEVTDGQIRDAAQQGARSLCDLQRCLGVATGCGRCQTYATDVLEEALQGPMCAVMAKAA